MRKNYNIVIVWKSIFNLIQWQIIIKVIIIINIYVKIYLSLYVFFIFFYFRIENVDLVVHFEIRFDPRYETITVIDIINILKREINHSTSKYLMNLIIDEKSLEVQENLVALNAQIALSTTVAMTSSTTTPIPSPRTCTKLDLTYCKHLPYNITSYPNIFGHQSITDVENDVIAFR